jgi:signal transduction histidine kinase
MPLNACPPIDAPSGVPVSEAQAANVIDDATAHHASCRAGRSRGLSLLAAASGAALLSLAYLPSHAHFAAWSVLSALVAQLIVIAAVPVALRGRVPEIWRRGLKGSVSRAREGERRRIVRDLHDGAQQRLVHAAIALERARSSLHGPEDSDVLVTEALSHVQDAIRELRDLAHGITPDALAHGGLRAGVETLAEEFQLPVAVDVSVDRLPLALEANAYFVVAEALTNIVKHAGASAVRVTATAVRGALRVEVLDDGVGGTRLDGGPGLRGLRHRVESIGGRLQVESAPRGGTLVVARFPIPAPVRRPSPGRLADLTRPLREYG